MLDLITLKKTSLHFQAMKIDKVVNFPFPSPPDMIQLRYWTKDIRGVIQINPESVKSSETARDRKKVTS
jgi:hypothetical protein